MFQKAAIEDLDALTRLALLLWPNHTFEELQEEIESLLSNPNAAYFLYFDQHLPAGFAQCQLRHDYVEGTESSPVGYLEGVFVLESHRKRGIAAELLCQCERWAAEKGCAEFASDCELDNAESHAFHLKCGFREANRVICFHKKLTPSNDKTVLFQCKKGASHEESQSCAAAAPAGRHAASKPRKRAGSLPERKGTGR